MIFRSIHLEIEIFPSLAISEACLAADDENKI